MNTLTCSPCECAPAPAANVRQPRYEASTIDHGYALKVYLPGVDNGQVDIAVRDDVLTIDAKRNRATPETWRPLAKELADGDYRLRVRLNAEVDPAGVAAKLADGVLTVTLPLSEALKPRVVPVE